MEAGASKKMNMKQYLGLLRSPF